MRALIATGRLPQGQSLPSSRSLAQGLGISRNTVTQAVEQLVAEGYLTLLPNRRPRVASDAALPAAPGPGRTAPAASPQLRSSAWGRKLAGLSWPPAAQEAQPRAFQAGMGDEREFPHAVWGRCLRLAASRVPRRSARGGNEACLQQALLAHLAARRGIRARPEQILLVPSAQAGLNLIARTMMDPGEVAWMESPGYGGAHAALMLAQARVIGVPLDPAGLVVANQLDAPRLIFVTPSHQYPTGRLMPVARRLALLAHAREVGAVVVEDDYDGDFHYDGRPVPALAGLDPDGTPLYVGTFSKAMSADIRVGYLVVPAALLPTFQLAQRHLGLFVPAAMQVALAEFIAGGDFLTHIRRMTRLYKARRDRLVQELAARAGSLAAEVPAGGMQLLARCDAVLDDVALCRALARRGVIARPLSGMFYHPNREQGLFLGFSAWNEEEIARGAATIGQVLAEFSAEMRRPPLHG
ncbi:PLP-dependent aminotransferase family protein [Roseomonas sp. GC11]|nr:PLP-dependent aminotransferase family protein [Roseomonas sp. GC11]